MVEILIILDGASEDPTDGPTSLERARTPALDQLCRDGAVEAVETTPAGMPPGSEVGIPTLLGASLMDPPSRGLIEAAAAGIDITAGTRAWRVDLPRTLAGDHFLHRAGEEAGLVHLRGHRWVAVASCAPPLQAPWRVWPDGPGLPRILDHRTVMISATGAASGCATLLGARTVVPVGATGDTDTNYQAKASAALDALDGCDRVVVHIGAPDEASHRGDGRAKVDSIEAIDELIVRPLTQRARGGGFGIRICPDHGTGTDGRHVAGPVPGLRWASGMRPTGPDRLNERALLGKVLA